MNLNDKIKGVFFGQAIGDALGLATEFMTKEQVVINYPHGIDSYNDILQDKHRSRWKPGQWTDDTDQWLCILDSLIVNGDLVPLDIAKRFHQWMTKGGMGIGMTTYKVMSLPQYTQFPFKASELIWKMKGKDLAPNGALMRNSIVCLYNFRDLESVLDNCLKIARLTHHDQRCVDSCKIMAHIINGELTGDPILLDSLDSLLSQYDPRIKEFILPLSYDISLLDLDQSASVGYTLKALSAGLWAYFYAVTFEDGIKAITMEAGDADTNACVAGSMLGAKFGFASFKATFVNSLIGKEQLEQYFEKFKSL